MSICTHKDFRCKHHNGSGTSSHRITAEGATDGVMVASGSTGDGVGFFEGDGVGIFEGDGEGANVGMEVGCDEDSERDGEMVTTLHVLHATGHNLDTVGSVHRLEITAHQTGSSTPLHKDTDVSEVVAISVTAWELGRIDGTTEGVIEGAGDGTVEDAKEGV